MTTSVQCPVCGVSIVHSSSLYRHIRSRHPTYQHARQHQRGSEVSASADLSMAASLPSRSDNFLAVEDDFQRSLVDDFELGDVEMGESLLGDISMSILNKTPVSRLQCVLSFLLVLLLKFNRIFLCCPIQSDCLFLCWHLLTARPSSTSRRTTMFFSLPPVDRPSCLHHCCRRLLLYNLLSPLLHLCCLPLLEFLLHPFCRFAREARHHSTLTTLVL